MEKNIKYVRFYRNEYFFEYSTDGKDYYSLNSNSKIGLNKNKYPKKKFLIKVDNGGDILDMGEDHLIELTYIRASTEYFLFSAELVREGYTTNEEDHPDYLANPNYKGEKLAYS